MSAIKTTTTIAIQTNEERIEVSTVVEDASPVGSVDITIGGTTRTISSLAAGALYEALRDRLGHRY